MQNKTIITIKNKMRCHDCFMFNIFKFIFCLEYIPSCLEPWFSNSAVQNCLAVIIQNTPGLQTKNLQRYGPRVYNLKHFPR